MKFAEWITNAENEYAWTHDGGAIIFPAATEALDKLVNQPAGDRRRPGLQGRLRGSREGRQGRRGLHRRLLRDWRREGCPHRERQQGHPREVDPKTALKTAQDQMNEKLKALGD